MMLCLPITAGAQDICAVSTIQATSRCCDIPKLGDHRGDQHPRDYREYQTDHLRGHGHRARLADVTRLPAPDETSGFVVLVARFVIADHEGHPAADM